MLAPSTRVTAGSARHVAREIIRRLYQLHTVDQADELTARQQAEASVQRAVAEAGAHSPARLAIVRRPVISAQNPQKPLAMLPRRTPPLQE
ncbi:hypothetical protein [Streptomyces sp. NPDC048496]|uniref:hypothetical protein n=1 Tax=Streptomyces sp. NPDC048496 TaxID=3365558 RepID=UPI003716231A